MDMKHWRYILFCLFAATLGCCTDEDAIDDMQKLPKEGILIRLSNGALVSTKTDLNSSANLHHVEEVHAFLYEGDATDQANASCVLSEKLNWNPMDSLGYGVDSVQVEEYLLENTLNLPSGNYTLLCVGLDDRSGSTYNLPAALNGKSLAEAKATLADAKTKNDIAHSELFAGWETFEYKRGALSRVDVEMRRRVAGVLCYLKDIPYTLTEGLKTYRITRVRLRLSGNQNSAVSLLRPKAKDVDDFGDTPLEASDTILSCVDLVKAKYGKQGTKNLYAIPVLENEFPKRQANTILMGAYLLPVKNENGDTPTLIVEVLGKSIASVDDKPADDAEEVVVKSFPAVQETAIDAPNRLRYSIRPNVIYHIGQKSSNGSTDGDYPESLAGTKLNLVVVPWMRENIDVDFPSVAVNSSMEFEKGYMDSYIFDCISYEEELVVYPSLLHEGWKLTVVMVDENGVVITSGEEPKKGVYIRSREPGTDGEYTYSKEYTANSTEMKTKTKVTIFIEDYANPDVNYNQVSLANDYRRYQLRLHKVKQATGEGELLQTIPVNQYNAIIVKFDDKVRGFRRYDLETYRTKQGGIEELNPALTEPGGGADPGKKNDGSGIYMGWGYWSMASTSIFSDYLIHDNDGWLNYARAEDHDIVSGAFSGCAIERSYDQIYKIQSEKRIMWNSGWYLPSRNELKAFFNLLKAQKGISDANIKNSSGDRYWTSCPYLTTFVDIVYYKNGSEVELDNIKRTNQCWIRQARHVE